MQIYLKSSIFLFISLSVLSCGKTYIPKPYGYFRIDLPNHTYKKSDTLNLPYRFDISTEAIVVEHYDKNEKYWIDIRYPKLNANIFCSYKQINGNLFQLSEDSHKYVYKHSIKAESIIEQAYDNTTKKVYGILYDLKGNTASSLQFVMTDSVKNFFRGALYFNNVPNKDSIAPISNYIRHDIIRLMESFEWTK